MPPESYMNTETDNLEQEVKKQREQLLEKELRLINSKVKTYQASLPRNKALLSPNEGEKI